MSDKTAPVVNVPSKAQAAQEEADTRTANVAVNRDVARRLSLASLFLARTRKDIVTEAITQYLDSQQSEIAKGFRETVKV